MDTTYGKGVDPGYQNVIIEALPVIAAHRPSAVQRS